MKNGKKYQKLNLNKLNLGFIGCGSVSEMYLDYLSKVKRVNLYACSDVNKKNAHAIQKRYKISKVLNVKELISDPQVDIVLNLTNPICHYDLNVEILKSGKNLFCEKPFALTNQEAEKILNLTKQNKCQFYCAPDTYLSKPIKAAKEYISRDKIGKVLSVNIISTCRPIENWHPNPEFFYQKGAGPLFDRGVYHITTLVYLFGDIERVAAFSSVNKNRRVLKDSKKIIKVGVATHYSCLLQFKNKITATFMVSFDSSPFPQNTDIMNIYGTDGVLDLPTPIEYCGESKSYDYKKSKWKSINNYSKGVFMKGDVRGAAILEMIENILNKKTNYKNAMRGVHVLKVMNAIEKSCKTSKVINIK